MTNMKKLIPFLLLLPMACEPITSQVQPPMVNHHHHNTFKISGASPTVYFHGDSAGIVPDELIISGATPTVYIGNDSIQLSGGWKITKLAIDTIIVDAEITSPITGPSQGEWVRANDTTYYISEKGDTLVETGY